MRINIYDEYKYVFLFKIVLFLVNYHECYFVFIEFEYYMKLFFWMMKTMVSPDFRGTWNR